MSKYKHTVELRQHGQVFNIDTPFTQIEFGTDYETVESIYWFEPIYAWRQDTVRRYYTQDERTEFATHQEYIKAGCIFAGEMVEYVPILRWSEEYGKGIFGDPELHKSSVGLDEIKNGIDDLVYQVPTTEAQSFATLKQKELNEKLAKAKAKATAANTA